MKPVFDITIGASTHDSKILVNDVDISHSIRAVSVECDASKGLTEVRFLCAGGAAKVRVAGILQHVDVDGKAVIRPGAPEEGATDAW